MCPKPIGTLAFLKCPVVTAEPDAVLAPPVVSFVLSKLNVFLVFFVFELEVGFLFLFALPAVRITVFCSV